MFGYVIASIAVFFWSIVNIIDKTLVERFSKDGGVGALLMLSALFPAVLIPISYLLSGSTLFIPYTDIAILFFTGVLNVAWIYLYLDSLQDDDVSRVVPLMQLTPVFALFFGLIFLNEWPTTSQLLAGAVIVVGSLIISVERTTGRIKLKLILSLAGVSAIFALIQALFKLTTTDSDFWVSMFWRSVGIMFVGISLFIFHKKYRCQFVNFIKANWGLGAVINSLNETLTVVGDVLFAFAVLITPLALVQTMEAYQPVFIFLIGLILSHFAPNILNEDVSFLSLAQKLLGITIIVSGSIWLILL